MEMSAKDGLSMLGLDSPNFHYKRYMDNDEENMHVDIETWCPFAGVSPSPRYDQYIIGWIFADTSAKDMQISSAISGKFATDRCRKMLLCAYSWKIKM